MMRHFLMAIFVVLLALPVAGQVNRLFMDDFEIEPDSLKTMSLILASEIPTRGFQFTLILPQGIYLDDCAVTDYSKEYKMGISCNFIDPSHYLLFVFPSIRVCYPPDTVAVALFTFGAASDFKGGDILIDECSCSTIDSESFPAIGDTVHVTVPSSSLIGIPIDQQPVKDQFFNLQGKPIPSAADAPVAIRVMTTPDGRRDSVKVAILH